ncbi:MAG TPA: acyltransferase [Chloroflexi bacterium]|nr:acyltransferase [Chloroflexota bacterium]
MARMIVQRMRRVWAGIRRRWDFFRAYYLLCHADRITYLRFLGVRIGERCSIYTDPHNFGTEPWLVELGDDVTVGQGVLFITHDGTSRLFRKHLQGASPFGNRFGTIRIRDNCFIGNNAILLPDIEIGPDSAVGAGSVVTRSVPPRTIVAGNPARPIRSLDAYIENYTRRMVPIEATDREALRRELTVKLWGEER